MVLDHALGVSLVEFLAGEFLEVLEVPLVEKSCPRFSVLSAACTESDVINDTDTRVKIIALDFIKIIPFSAIL
jgi:hypothetical protein